MLTTYQKAALGILTIGVFAVALVIAAKGPALAATPVVGSGGPITLVQGQQGGPPPGIVVTGEAKLSYKPDVAYLTLGTVEQAATAATAQAQLATRMAKLFAAAKQLGIQDKDIANGGYSLTPLYAYSQDKAPKITGYQAQQQAVVTLRDVSAVGKTLDALVRDDAATTASLQFALSAGKDPMLDARARAIQDAKDKASAMANAAGVRLGAAISITEVTPQSPMRNFGMDYAKPAAMAPSQVPTGDVELTVQMQVQFGILAN